MESLPCAIMRSNKRDPVVTPASARYANLSQTTALFLLASSDLDAYGYTYASPP